MSAIFGSREQLVAVGVHANRGPVVLLEGVVLVGRAPSEVRADISGLALRCGVKEVPNAEGEQDVPAWGVSTGAVQQWLPDAGGFLQRGDAMVTDVLVAGPDLAEDRQGERNVASWRRNSRRRAPEPGPWTVRPERERPRWECVPLERVGPLRFGMTPEQVSAALGGEAASSRRTYHPYPAGSRREDQGDPAEERLVEERFEAAGVRAHYPWWEQGRGPFLGAVTALGRSGPQALLDGIPLVGRPVTAVEADIVRYLTDNDLGLRFLVSGDQEIHGLGVTVRTARVGDGVISEARLGAEQWYEE
ncbi:hypothetical protein HUT16_04650 [Kitasatospora sp. NA04385]|uniref:hypothetical protein n=1 Tax=Kitasatospora sp. NA04385 TaxID=2742135 RepID=UPI001590E5CA|nr:hypothetical protein [Kitasatospora sp. NA04385]QKW18449.1 hypothetical protein HUT16_04650 [Kitasatospora sp. NA04385]